MQKTQAIFCPNCGKPAKRRYFTLNQAPYSFCPSNQVIQTECPACDYLMVMCSLNGSVIEAYAPATSASTNLSKQSGLAVVSVKDSQKVPLLR